jgi:uncharacterized membrane protein YccC
MGKRKPLSMAEKQTKMLELFHETASFYTYKEIERLADKQKGITPQSAKDVLDELVSQQKVSCEKLASQTLYYALPSQDITRRKRVRVRLDSETEQASAAISQLESRLQKRQAVRPPLPPLPSLPSLPPSLRRRPLPGRPPPRHGQRPWCSSAVAGSP